MLVFLDDLSMPVINTWGDQITNELTRQLIEQNGFYFLDKDKRGDFKTIEGLKYLGAMGHPGGGKNDIPPRLKSKFLSVNMVPPLQSSVSMIYGSILKASFTAKRGAKPDVIDLSPKLVMATPLESIGNKEVLVNLWRHENTRVFADKLARMVDKDFVDKCVQEFATGHFGED